MDNVTYDSNDNLKKIYSQDSLLDVLIEIEGVLDSMDLYAFKNWINGEVIHGPILEKYWITVVLKYPYKEMPDPRGGLRLMKHGVKIYYMLTTEAEPVNLSDYKDNRDEAYTVDEETGETKRKTEDIDCWYIKLILPRRFVDETEKGIAVTDDDDIVDLEKAEEAETEGLDDESIISGENEEGLENETQ